MPLATRETDKSVDAFIASVDSDSKQADSRRLMEIMSEATGFEPKVWGDNFIIGFGKYTYRRKGGKEDLEWFHVGFAPRKTKLTVYLTFDMTKYQDLLDQLGKAKWGKGCLYINKLEDINLDILKQLIEKSKDARWH